MPDRKEPHLVLKPGGRSHASSTAALPGMAPPSSPRPSKPTRPPQAARTSASPPPLGWSGWTASGAGSPGWSPSGRRRDKSPPGMRDASYRRIGGRRHCWFDPVRHHERCGASRKFPSGAKALGDYPPRKAWSSRHPVPNSTCARRQRRLPESTSNSQGALRDRTARTFASLV